MKTTYNKAISLTRDCSGAGAGGAGDAGDAGTAVDQRFGSSVMSSPCKMVGSSSEPTNLNSL